MSSLFTLPQQQPLDSSANLYPGALAYFYVTATSTPKSVYADAGLVTPHSNPVVADSNGVFPAIWLAEDQQYRVTLKDSGGATVDGYPVDGVGGPTMSRAEIGAALFPQSTAENAASVDPPNKYHIWGWQGRYSSLADSIAQQDAGGAPVVSGTGGMRLVGYLGGNTARPEAQLILENTATSGHAILTMVNHNKTDESAWEAVGELDSGGLFQHGAQFWRYIGNDNGATTHKSVWAVHVTRYGADNCPLIVSSNNGILVCGGDTTTEKWATELEANTFDIYTKGKARTSFTVGTNHSSTTATGFSFEVENYAQFGNTASNAIDKALRVGYDTGSDTAFVEGYQNSSSVYKPITVRGTTINLAGGDTIPGTNNTYKLGDSSHRWTEVFATNGTINTSDATLKDFEDDYSDEEIKWALAIRDTINPFRWKADKKKKHFGVAAQLVHAIGLECGIADPLEYGFLIRDEDGGEVHWGVNYAELSMFILGAL